MRRITVLFSVVVALAAPSFVPQNAVAETPTYPGRIAFHQLLQNQYGHLYGGEVLTINPDGSDLRQVSSEIPDASSPRWFDGGKRLAFDADGAVVATAPDGTSRERLFQADFFLMHPAISNAGDRLAYLNPTTGDLVVANVDGSDPRTISPTPESAFLPAWSPDGLTLAYTYRNASTAKKSIWLVDADGQNRRQAIPESFDASGPAFSPDGAHIAFSSESGTNDGSVGIARLDGTQVRVLDSASGARDSQPTFSPDGSKVAFVRTTDTSSGLWVMNVDGTGAHRIFEGRVGSPAWQPVPGTTPATTTTTSTTAPQNRAPIAEITFTWASDPLAITVAGNASTDPDGSITAYQWHWGDGATPAATKIAAHRYAKAGSYRVRLTVTDDDGARDAAAFWVRVR